MTNQQLAMLIKGGIAIILFASWYALLYFQVPNATDFIAFIKEALLGLGLYHAVTTDSTPALDSLKVGSSIKVTAEPFKVPAPPDNAPQ